MWLVEGKKSTEVEYGSVGEVEKGREVENVESRVEKVHTSYLSWAPGAAPV